MPSQATGKSMSTSDALAALRTSIDQLDGDLIDLWRKRQHVAQEVGRARVAAGGTRVVLAREQQVLHRYRNELGEDGVRLALLLLRAGRGPL